MKKITKLSIIISIFAFSLLLIGISISSNSDANLIYHQEVNEAYGIPPNLGTLSAKTQSLYWKCIETGAPFTEDLCDYMYLRYGTQLDEYFKCGLQHGNVNMKCLHYLS